MLRRLLAIWAPGEKLETTPRSVGKLMISLQGDIPARFTEEI
jgi:hypothetical protein